MIGSSRLDELLEFLQPSIIVRAASRRVDQHEIELGKHGECGRQLFG